LESFAKKKEQFSEKIILDIHRVILSGIDDRYAGRYRDVNVRILGAVKSPPRFEKVPGLMKEFVEYASFNPDRLNHIELAAYVHYRFVEIHPFSDGNGRCARLLMNLYLLRHGYPITMVLKVDRKKYYDRLKKADLGDLKSFANFIASNVERSLDLYLDAFRAGEDYVSLAEAAKDTRYSQEYLSLLARKGIIDAVKLGRNWFIKRAAIESYLKRKDK
jgi:excisionase family DNA binding protein